MLRSLWEWLVQLDPTLAAALTAAVVSILGTVLTILSPIGGYLLAKRQLRDRLKTEYEYEQRKKLRDLIGCYHGGILQAVEEFNYRMMSLYASEDEDWLNVGDDYQGVGSDPNNYYFQTTVHRFLALFVLIRRFESEALYADSRIADKKDFEFLKYSRAILWAATGTHLFSGLAYDVSESKDHFFRDGKTTSSGMT